MRGTIQLLFVCIIFLSIIPFAAAQYTSTIVLADNSSSLKLTSTTVSTGIEQHLSHSTPQSNSYISPYKVTLFNPQNGEDKARLWSQTKVIFGLGIAVTGVIAVLPSSVSNWDEDNSGKFSEWSKNVSSGPVWDDDKWVVNYIGHPYFGGVYYQVARNAGYDQWDSFVYTTLMSTFYYEYGIEALQERPSIQDLIVTAVGGWAYGEWAYHKEQELRANNGSKTALFFLNPVESISQWINRITGRKWILTGTIDLKQQATTRQTQGESLSDYVVVNLSVRF